MNKYKISQKSGFTLIELMVVIVIILLLTAIITANFGPSRSKARDSQRISDLGQIQLALSLYFDRCNQYPSSISGTLTSINNGCPLGSGISLASYIGKIPTPPSGPASYDYSINSSGVPANYILHTQLENSNGAQKNSLQDTTGSWTPAAPTCYNGTASNKEYCLGPK